MIIYVRMYIFMYACMYEFRPSKILKKVSGPPAWSIFCVVKTQTDIHKETL